MRIQIISTVTSIVFLFFIVRLIVNERLREGYSILWIFMGLVFLFLSLRRGWLDAFGLFVGIAYPPIAVLLLMIMCLILILIQYSVVVSDQTNKIKRLSQEIGLLNLKFSQIEKADLKKMD